MHGDTSIFAFREQEEIQYFVIGNNIPFIYGILYVWEEGTVRSLVPRKRGTPCGCLFCVGAGDLEVDLAGELEEAALIVRSAVIADSTFGAVDLWIGAREIGGVGLALLDVKV